MNWTELLKSEIEHTYTVTDKLLDIVDEDSLDWKPSAENNWMTTGQLLSHITDACGMPIRGFVTGDWGLPEGVELSDLSPEEMLPPAEKLPTIESVAKAKELLAADKKLALDMLGQCDEKSLANNISRAPWDSSEIVLGYRLLQMISHLSHHKSQLFYYLKLQGKPVNTGHLWGA
jgi:uncharacterized damage-inducible protein DinB